MFGFSKKRKPKNLLEELIVQMYGSLDHKKTANLVAATRIAYKDLLCECIDEGSVQRKAAELFTSEIPYSTNDLALSVAMPFFVKPENHEVLKEAQLVARLQMLEWLQDRSIAPPLAKVFENSLYKAFNPSNR